MLLHLPLAFLTASAAPPFVGEARAAARGDAIVVEVEGEGGATLDASAVRARVSSGVLQLELGGVRARSGNRAWGDGDATIRAHRHASYTELEVPLVGARACAGPVSVAPGEGGSIVATVRCGAARVDARPVARAQASEDDEADIPRPSKRGLSPRPPARGVPVLAAAAKADPETAEQEELRAAVAREVVKKPPAPDKRVEPVKAAEPAKAAVPAKPAEPTPEPPKAAEPTPAVAAAGSSGGFAVTPVLALLALGGAGAYFARRRKRPTRLVQILETTSLGPKRSLIVAKLGDQTLVLGASEAGIAVLQSAGAKASPKVDSLAGGALPIAEQVDLGSIAGAKLDTGEIWPTGEPDVAAANAAAARASVGDPANDTKDEDVAADTSGQAHFLAKLFRGRKPKELSEEWPFDEVLEDSFEDQELRAKLAAGMGAKVP